MKIRLTKQAEKAQILMELEFEANKIEDCAQVGFCVSSFFNENSKNDVLDKKDIEWAFEKAKAQGLVQNGNP